MGLLYRETYEVPFYESDTNHYMKLPQLLALALQISAKQSLKLGIGDDIVFKRYGLVWVVTDYIIDIECLPKHAEKIVIETEAKAHNKLLCYRYFYIYGEDGQKIITISSAFVLMDFKTRKIHPVLDDITSIYQSQRIKKVIRGPKYHPIGDSKVKQYHVRYFDLDMNGHVNNSKYLEWMYDVLDLDFLSSHIPKKIDLKYIKEIQYGTDIKSHWYQDGLVTRHDIIGGDAIHAQARIEWQEKKED